MQTLGKYVFAYLAKRSCGFVLSTSLSEYKSYFDISGKQTTPEKQYKFSETCKLNHQLKLHHYWQRSL